MEFPLVSATTSNQIEIVFLDLQESISLLPSNFGALEGGARSREVTILKVRSTSPIFESVRSPKIGPVFARSTPVLNELIPKILHSIAFQIS